MRNKMEAKCSSKCLAFKKSRNCKMRNGSYVCIVPGVYIFMKNHPPPFLKIFFPLPPFPTIYMYKPLRFNGLTLSSKNR